MWGNLFFLSSILAGIFGSLVWLGFILLCVVLPGKQTSTDCFPFHLTLSFLLFSQMLVFSVCVFSDVCSIKETHIHRVLLVLLFI